MRTFTDTAGRTWTVTVNTDAIKRVRGLTDVDLLGLLEGGLLERFYRDPILVCDVVYALCKPQADQHDLGESAFLQAMAGDAIDHALQALLEEVVDFCPSRRDRDTLRHVLEATQKGMDRARDLIEARLQSGHLDQAVEHALATAMNSSGDAPASSASIPGP